MRPTGQRQRLCTAAAGRPWRPWRMNTARHARWWLGGRSDEEARAHPRPREAGRRRWIWCAGQTTGMAEMRRTRSLGLGPSRRRAREGAVRRPTGHGRLLGGGVARARRRAGAGSHAEATRRRPRAREEVGRARGRAPTELLAGGGRKQRRGRGAWRGDCLGRGRGGPAGRGKCGGRRW